MTLLEKVLLLGFGTILVRNNAFRSNEQIINILYWKIIHDSVWSFVSHGKIFQTTNARMH